MSEQLGHAAGLQKVSMATGPPDAKPFVRGCWQDIDLIIFN